MKVDKIIFAIDDNPKYDGLWKINSEICKKVLGITPVLFHITDEDSDFYDDEFGLIKKIKKLPEYPTGYQSQIYRMFGTKYFLDEVCIISDIDMLITNKSYIEDQVKEFSEDDFVVYISDAYSSKREECVGLYSEPRVSMCYNAAKGRTFNEIINTDRSFEEFISDVSLISEHVHDRDEIYLGQKIQNFHNQNKIKRLERGYTSPFICSKRNDRPSNENFFNEFKKEDITNGNIVDIHLSRPYIKHKTKIDELSRFILNDHNEIYLIGCHIVNETQEKYLRELIDNLIEKNKKFVLVSHTILPTDIVSKSFGFVYDSDNPTYKTWELDGFPLFYFENDFFRLDSPYITYGAADYYHVGAVRNFINGIKFLKNTNFEIVHWIEYDSLPDFDLNESANKLLSNYDFIFYGVGSRFSFNLSKVNNNFLNLTNQEIFEGLKKEEYIAERFSSKNLTTGSTKTIFMNESQTNTWGRFSQNFNNTKINWSLFEDNNLIKLFIHNITNLNQSIEIKINNSSQKIQLDPYNWFIIEVSEKNKLSEFEIICDSKKIISDNLSNKKKYDNIIKKVLYTKKND